ncbi:MAG: molybdate ABC transporter substrate-binding protein [Thiothrix lacustris]|uniref:Molybdate ABC transporter substrate-binding protein n=1 Tax=Thiothrix lacustris TaxID=525917 RepID=A0A1Y1QG36_9GAMM|nr:MAG: molybdate ABC transporter substrate-binding protein [Thiothrix lacustris]
MKLFKTLGLAITLSFSVASAWAEDVPVAVAANFTKPMEKIAADFEKATGNKAVLSFGATGKFVEQIKNGAPFQILVSADQKSPIKLEKEALAVLGTRYTYAIGKLVLWSAKPQFVDDKGTILKTNSDFEHIAIADPKVAPYGKAAMQVMEKMGVLDTLKPKMVQGESIGQTKEFVASGNAELGFVALSQVIKETTGSSWMIPQDLYSPLYQDVILLKTGESSAAAKALLDYLRSDAALAVIKDYGYDQPDWAKTDAK